MGVAKFEELTGLNVPTNLTEVKDAVGKGLTSAADLQKVSTTLLDYQYQPNLTELKDSLSSTFKSTKQKDLLILLE